MMKKLVLGLFSFLRYLSLRPIFFCHMGKWLDKKVNFKVYDVTTWETVQL